MSAKLIVKCEEYLQAVRDFADITSQREQFESQLAHLTDYLPEGWIVELYSDFAPYSFFWTQSTPTGQGGLIGGLIYHGLHDGGGSGGAPIFSVNLIPINGWSIHT